MSNRQRTRSKTRHVCSKMIETCVFVMRKKLEPVGMILLSATQGVECTYILINSITL